MISDKWPKLRTWNLKGEVKYLENCECPPLYLNFNWFENASTESRTIWRLRKFFSWNKGHFGKSGSNEKYTHENYRLALIAVCKPWVGCGIPFILSVDIFTLVLETSKIVTFSAANGFQRLHRETDYSPPFPNTALNWRIFQKKMRYSISNSLRLAPNLLTFVGVRDCQGVPVYATTTDF